MQNNKLDPLGWGLVSHKLFGQSCLTAQVQNASHSSEGALSSLEETLADRDKQISQVKEQRDRAEKDVKEEKELHERELAEYKMKIHTYESEVEKLQVQTFLFLYFLISNCGNLMDDVFCE